MKPSLLVCVACSAALGALAGWFAGDSRQEVSAPVRSAITGSESSAGAVDRDSDIRTLLVTRATLSGEFWADFANHESRFLESFRNELSVRALKFGLGRILNERGCLAAYHDLAAVDPTLAAWVTSTNPPPAPAFLCGEGNEPLESLFMNWSPKVLGGFIRAVADQPQASAWAREVFRQLYRGPGARTISATSVDFLTKHIGSDEMRYAVLTMEMPDAHDDAVLRAVAGGGSRHSPEFIGWVISQMVRTGGEADLVSPALEKHPDACLHALRLLWVTNPDLLPELLKRIPTEMAVTPAPAEMETPSHLGKERLDAIISHLKHETPAAFTQWVGNALMQETGDIRQIVEMATRFPDDLRKPLLSSAMEAFAYRCPLQASQYLEGLPDSRDKLFLVESFAATSPDTLIKDAWNREAARLRTKHP